MKSPYHYTKRGNNWAVYKWENEHKMSAIKVATFSTRDDAKNEVYKLNGWKPPKN